MGAPKRPPPAGVDARRDASAVGATDPGVVTIPPAAGAGSAAPPPRARRPRRFPTRFRASPPEARGARGSFRHRRQSRRLRLRLRRLRERISVVASLSQRGGVRRLRASRPLVQPPRSPTLLKYLARPPPRGAGLRRSRVRSERARRSVGAHPARPPPIHRRAPHRRAPPPAPLHPVRRRRGRARGGSGVMFHLGVPRSNPSAVAPQTIYSGGEVRTRTRRRGEVDGRGGGRGLTGCSPRASPPPRPPRTHPSDAAGEPARVPRRGAWTPRRRANPVSDRYRSTTASRGV